MPDHRGVIGPGVWLAGSRKPLRRRGLGLPHDQGRIAYCRHCVVAFRLPGVETACYRRSPTIGPMYFIAKRRWYTSEISVGLLPGEAVVNRMSASRENHRAPRRRCSLFSNAPQGLERADENVAVGDRQRGVGRLSIAELVCS